MKKANIIFSIIFAVFSVAVIVYTYNTFPAGRQGVPGPGVFPIIVASVMLLCSIIIFLTYIRSKDDKPFGLISESTIRAYITIGLMVVYLVAAPIVGFLAVTFLFLVGTIKWFSKRGWIYVVSVSLGINVFVYVSFSIVLNVPLPTGFLM